MKAVGAGSAPLGDPPLGVKALARSSMSYSYRNMHGSMLACTGLLPRASKPFRRACDTLVSYLFPLTSPTGRGDSTTPHSGVARRSGCCGSSLRRQEWNALLDYCSNDEHSRRADLGIHLWPTQQGAAFILVILASLG